MSKYCGCFREQFGVFLCRRFRLQEKPLQTPKITDDEDGGENDDDDNDGDDDDDDDNDDDDDDDDDV